MDISALRRDTPGAGRAIHLNAAGASLVPRPVLETMVTHLTLEAELGGYEAADAVAGRRAEGYADLARLVGARPGEIAFVESATHAFDRAFYAIPFKPGDRILTTTSEYNSNALAYVQASQRYGTAVEVVPDDAHGTIDLEALERSLGRGGVRLVSINHMPTHDGLVNPVADVGRLAREHGALFLLDACQSAGQTPLDVEEIRCDLLSAAGRKFLRGPRGTGFLYVRREIMAELDPPVVDLHSADLTGPGSFTFRDDARRFETWERSVAAELALAEAARYALGLGLEAISVRVRALAASFRAALADLPGITVHDRGLEKSAIVTFTHDRFAAYDLVAALAARGVVTRVSEQTYRYDEGPAPRHRVRASFHYYVTEDELTEAVEILRSL
ncbi:aminotransferase class V-fold PLP-dependent enzyme [Actinocorallia longicatena]|uniref:Aminotransferase class V-fold PLP-dependent enzyme n=1 Tax=Actinocorallia longicatena TaxID=111803 RepID=A0ABP6QBR0_9ACTN